MKAKTESITYSAPSSTHKEPSTKPIYMNQNKICMYIVHCTYMVRLNESKFGQNREITLSFTVRSELTPN